MSAPRPKPIPVERVPVVVHVRVDDLRAFDKASMFPNRVLSDLARAMDLKTKEPSDAVSSS